MPRELPARRGFSVLYRGKTLLSRVDPIAQAERLATEIPVRERTLYFCPSPLYGYGLSLFLKRLEDELKQKNSAVLCVEADDRLFEISKKAFKEGEENPRLLALTNVSGAESLCAFVHKTWGERMFRRVEVIRLTGGWQLSPELYDDLAETLRREIAREWGNAMTLIRLGRLYSRNLIRNLAMLPFSQDIKTLDFGAAPVLVLGAGPSLDPLLDELAALAKGKIGGPKERRFRIICVDTCIPALDDRGIVPDLVVILESQHWNLRDFSGARNREIDAALDLSALPASGRVLGGKRYFFFTPWTELTFLKRLEEAGLLPEAFAPLGSVGLSAVAMALYAASGPVITGGIDFAYTLDAYHARSTPGYRDRERRRNRFSAIFNPVAFSERGFTVNSKEGSPVHSDPVMRNYRNLFEQEFGGNPRVMDVKSSGLFLGVKTVSAGEAFAILNAEKPGVQPSRAARTSGADESLEGQREKIAAFAQAEIDSLTAVKGMLTGETPVDNDRLEKLLDALDYLWAHFPDCAGAGGRRPQASDLGFIKRIRAELEPFIKLWELTLDELVRSR